MKKKVIFGVEEAFIIVLIFLALAEFFGMLSSELEFVKKLISWTILGFLLYQASITKIFFGDKHKGVDCVLITAFFLIILKNLVSVSALVVSEGLGDFFFPLHALIVDNLAVIEIYGFIVGTALIIIISLFLTFNLHVKKPSIIHVLHDQGIPNTFRKRIERFLIVFLVLNAFFILVFNLLMEWLAIVVDASIVVFAILFFIFVFIKNHGKRFNVEHTLFKVADGAEQFYVKFIALFHIPKRIFLGFSGLLVLHLLTDMAIFIMPYLFTFQNIIYFGESEITSIESGISVVSLYKEQIFQQPVLIVMGISYVYLVNVIAILILLVTPTYLWWKVYRRKGFKVTHTELALFFGAMVTFMLAPIFSIGKISSLGLVGVSIMTGPINSLFDVNLIALSSLFIALFVFAISYSHKLKEFMLMKSLFIIASFFSFYIYSYFFSNWDYYVSSISALWGFGSYYISAYFVLFFVIISAAYVGGWIVFLIEIIKEYRYIR